MRAAVESLTVNSQGDLEAPRIRVLIADDHPLIVAGIRRTFEHVDDIEVVGEARSGPELIALVGRRHPELVLMDLRMPGVVGFDCIAQLHEQWPEVKVIVFSAIDDRTVIDGALRAGANAYVVKSAGPVDLAAVLHQAASGAVFLALARPAPNGGATDELEGPCLTERERSVLQAVAAGLTTNAISRQLWVSEHTVKFHLTNIYRKLGVANRAGAVRYAIEHGIIAS